MQSDAASEFAGLVASAGHALQAVCPADPRYFPAGQFSHVSDDCAVDALYLPALQSVQAVAPVDAMYLPAAQTVQESAKPPPPAVAVVTVSL